MKIYNYLIVLYCLFSLNTTGQSTGKKAETLFSEGIQLIEAGKLEDANQKLKEAKILDASNPKSHYLEGYLFYKRKQYVNAISQLEMFVKSGKARPDAFRLLGNCYELNNDRQAGVKIYEKALKLFPKSGEILLEMGLSEMFNKNYKKALDYFETGIKSEPNFASNYFWASKLMNQTSEKVWVLIYGELFMNIERNTDRTIEMGIMLYNVYKDAFTQKSDTARYVQFTQMWLKAESKSGTLIKPKSKVSFEQRFTEAMSGNTVRKEFDINILNNYRTSFLADWFSEDNHKKFPNTLFTYLNDLKENGKFELYNYWLFQEGNPESMAKWYMKNTTRFDDFLVWFSDHQLKIDKENKVYRKQFWK